jgi:uncharacterized membrane protein YphA (DoxX/SURF4 family)
MFVKFFGIFLVVLIFVASGAFKLMDPVPHAKLLQASNFPQLFVKPLGLKLGNAEYIQIIQATGALMVFGSVMVLFNIMRGLFALGMAVGLAVIAVCFHLDIKNPAATPDDKKVQLLKDIAIIGGLLVIAATSGSKRVKAREESPAAKKRQ